MPTIEKCQCNALELVAGPKDTVLDTVSLDADPLQYPQSYIDYDKVFASS